MKTVESSAPVLIDDRDIDGAARVLATLGRREGHLLVNDEQEVAQARRLPPHVGMILQQVLQAMADGTAVTVTPMPAELTSTTAARVLGISRPTLMKMIREGRLPAHRVGTHTRVRAEDVLRERGARRERERAAFAALRALTADEAE